MATTPKKVSERLKKAIPRFQKILQNAMDRDVNESDTVTIITDMLADVFGFDKYTEITSEQAIKGTYCDLAIKLDGAISYLIEVKAIGTALNNNHLRQALNYGANEGVKWVLLTNGRHWEVYHITLDTKVSSVKVCAFDFLEISPRSQEDQKLLFLLCREGLAKAAIEDFHNRQKTFNRFVVAALMGTDPVLGALRREIRKLSPGIKISIEDLQAILPEVLKRDVLDGDEVKDAAKQIRKTMAKIERKKIKAAKP